MRQARPRLTLNAEQILNRSIQPSLRSLHKLKTKIAATQITPEALTSRSKYFLQSSYISVTHNPTPTQIFYTTAKANKAT